MGAVDLGERWLLLMLGALAVPERADVGGESRLLLGRVVAVLQEHGRLKLAPLLLQQVSLRGVPCAFRNKCGTVPWREGACNGQLQLALS